MADKDVQVSVSGSGVVSVDKQVVEVKKGMDQVKWNITATGLESLTLTRKDNGEVLASCTPGNGNSSCSCKSKTFETEGTISYMVTVRVSGTDHELDPDIVIKP
ncbi:MAG TPA: hypothetical protein VGF48_20195 [Thermoanaerobaculia bacterium]|jgi:hypothetical protein